MQDRIAIIIRNLETCLLSKFETWHQKCQYSKRTCWVIVRSLILVYICLQYTHDGHRSKYFCNNNKCFLVKTAFMFLVMP